MLTYLALGWMLVDAEMGVYGWGGIVGSIIVLCLLFTSPIERLQKPIDQWFKTDFATFLTVLLGSFLIVVIATYLDTFAKFVLIISATTLSRMELQTQGIKNWSAFFILLGASLLGLVLGFGIHYLIKS